MILSAKVAVMMLEVRTELAEVFHFWFKDVTIEFFTILDWEEY